jgi:endonuclease I
MKLLQVLVLCYPKVPEIYNINKVHINNNKYTLEHIFPKTYMNKKSFNDIHNIYICNNAINNMRSNYKFTDFHLHNKTVQDDFKRLFNTDNFISNKYKLFIPENESKGIISRSIMYMSYEYKYRYNKIIDTKVLIDWCLNNPPSKEEVFHNHLASIKQFKRNKFIDLFHKRNYKSYVYNQFK